MNIVAYALARKYTIAVIAILLGLFGGMSARQMPADVLPSVDIPSVNIIWTYAGLTPREMAAKVTAFAETSALNNIDNVREITSETLNGVAVLRVTFQPQVNIELALSQATAVSQTILRRMPSGATPPLIVRFSQSSVPVLQLVVSSDTLTPGQINDWVSTRLRPQVVTIPGVRMSLPYGAASRQVMIDIDPARLQQFGLAATDVARALSAQNLTLPTGRIREGERELQVALNASPDTAAGFADLPVSASAGSAAGGVVRLSDVATVRDGEAVASSVVRLNGQNAVLVSLIKLGDASATRIVSQLMARLPEIRASAPPGVTVEPIFNQVQFVDAAITGVLLEAGVVAVLVGLVVLLFLASWRSALIVLTSIPLALLGSLVGLQLSGQTLNLMTLGGLALAIGILVDNAVVTIENIERRIEEGEPVATAVLTGSNEVLFPELVSTLVICIVFVPIMLLGGVSAYIFQPLALAVVFAMIASFLLSRTLVPVLVSLLLPADLAAGEQRLPALLRPLQHAVERGLHVLGAVHARVLQPLLSHPIRVALAALAALVLASGGLTVMPRTFFPTTDTGLIRMHLRAPAGTRLEETATRFAAVEQAVREALPPGDIAFVVANVGLPDPINIGWVPTAAIGSFDGELLLQLGPGHRPTETVEAVMRQVIATQFPDLTVFFRAADATSQTLAGAAATDIDVRFAGRDVPGNAELAKRFMAAAKNIPGVADLSLRQVNNLPEYFIRVDRVRASQLGLTPADAMGAILGVLGSGGTVTPAVWADERVGISYSVQIQAPVLSLASADDLLNTTVRSASGGPPLVLRSFATIEQRPSVANVSRAGLSPTLNVQLNAVGRDLGGVHADVLAEVARLRPELKPANRIEVSGQAAEMAAAYADLARGLGLAVILVYLVIVVNFQSWRLPLAALGALPFACLGGWLGLILTGTPLSVPALMGLIMVVGVSSANSVLLASFARDSLATGLPALDAAQKAAVQRLRPILMTAIAMILGMIPMALGLGEAGAQNAPLGRVVIGGLVCGTVASLLVVPSLFAAVAGRRHPSAT